MMSVQKHTAYKSTDTIYFQVCLEILHFSNYSGDAENSVMRETWTRLLDQALAIGGVGEACSVVRRVGPLLYPGDGGSMPLHTICLHLETAAHVKYLHPNIGVLYSCLYRDNFAIHHKLPKGAV